MSRGRLTPENRKRAQRRLPDSRLRMERRPKWLDERMSAKVLMSMIAGKHLTGAELLHFRQQLQDLVIALSSCDEHPFTEHNIDDGPRCRVCQCTSYECIGCVERTGCPCMWSEEDPTVCTACVKPAKKGGAQ